MKHICIYLILSLVLLPAGSCVASKEAALKVNGKTVELTRFKHYRYASFDLSKPARITLVFPDGIDSCEVSPHSRGIIPEISRQGVSFTLDRPGYVMIRVNGKEKIFLFAETPETGPEGGVLNITDCGVVPGDETQTEAIQHAMDFAAQEGKTLLIPAGVYTAAQLRPRSNTHIHLMRGAILQADTSSAVQYASEDGIRTRKFIYIKDADNVKITGYGILNGNGAALRARYGDEGRMRMIMAVNSANLLIEGVMLQDPGSWNTQILMCEDVRISRVKLMNDPDLSNTDGFDPDASRNVLIENCFAYCGDDNVAIKITGQGGYLGDVDHVTVRGCVFLTQKSSLKVGTETRGETMSNITFEDNDVLESDRGMALYVSDGALFSGIRYLNNRFERNYPDAKRAGFYFQVNRRDTDSKLGRMEDILIRDCTFETPFPRLSEISYEGEGEGIRLEIDNLTVGGRQVTEKDLVIKNASVVFR